MHFTFAALLATAAVGINAQLNITGKLGNAKPILNNPAGVTYEAVLPGTAFTKGSAYAKGDNVKGFIKAVAAPDGAGVVFKVDFSNLPKEGGPFKYHIHDGPVPEDGNCTKTLDHLDPYIRGQDPACNSKSPETCEVGDLSGKHGAINATGGSFTATYTDLFASTHEGIGAFFGNRSFVFHYSNKTRITCANFFRLGGGGGDTCGGGKGGSGGNVTTPMPSLTPRVTSVPTTTGSPPKFSGPATTSPPPPVTAGAATLGVGVASLMAAAAAALL